MTPRAKLSTSLDGRILLEVPFLNNAIARDKIDPRRKWSPMEKAWSFPCETAVIERLMEAFNLDRGQLPEDLRVLAPKAKEIPALKPKMELLEGYEFITPPYEHQREGLALLLEYDHFLLSWEMGCGKTKTVCDRVRYGMRHIDRLFSGPILILCPKSVLFVWGAELIKHARLESGCWPTYGPEDVFDTRHNILIANYDALTSEKNLDRFLKVPWEAIITDECQRHKRTSSRRTKAVLKLAEKARYRWALSGTPAPNGPQDWFGTLSFLDPKICGTTSKTAFEFRYCIKERAETGGARITGYQNLQELNEKVASVSDRRLKEDCLKDLPPKVFLSRYCELSKPVRKIYNDLRKQAVARLSAEGMLTVRNILTESLRLLQVVGGFCPDDEGKMHALEPNAKMDLFKDVVDEIGNEPIVVWCAFIEELKAVASWLSDQGRNVRSFHGQLNDADRKSAVEDFQAGKVDAFVATAASGGTGLTLTAASNEIFYSKSYNLEHRLQAIDRLHRPGQTKAVNVFDLLAASTVDEKVAMALETKASLQELVMRRGALEELL